MQKRNRSHPAESFEVRLQKYADTARAKACKMPPGKDRDALIREAIQTENVLNVSELLSLDRPNRPTERSKARARKAKIGNDNGR